ncbi:MAG TPA: hypothetical protein VF407_04115 [Polyangiaceae bacterium]
MRDPRNDKWFWALLSIPILTACAGNVTDHFKGVILVIGALAWFADFVFVLWSAQVRFGNDGFAWTHVVWAREPRFVSWSEVGAIVTNRNALILHDAKYPKLETMLMPRVGFLRLLPPPLADIEAEVRERLHAFEHAKKNAPLDTLDLTTADEGYRSGDPSEKRLALVAAPHAKAIERWKAARLLYEHQHDGETKATILAIAAASAEPWLRESLTSVVSDAPRRLTSSSKR